MCPCSSPSRWLGTSSASSHRREVGAHVAAKGAARGGAHPRAQRARGAGRACIHLPRGCACAREGSAVRGVQRGDEPRHPRGPALHRACVCRRRSRDEALARACTRSRGADQEAHVPHHRAARRDAGCRGSRHAGAAGCRGKAAARDSSEEEDDDWCEENDDEAQSHRDEEEGDEGLMGQKVHPGGMRVGVIHDWKSNWYTGKKEFPDYLIEDIKIREHITNKLSHAGLSDILIRKDKQRITIDVYK